MKKINLFQASYKTLAFALPLSAGGLIDMLASFISMMMAAQLGTEQLAAGNLAIPIWITLITITSTVFYAVSIFIGHHRANQKSPAEIGLYVKNGFWLALSLAVPAALILWHVDSLLILLGLNKQLIALAQPYFHFTALGIAPSLFITVIVQFYLGIGKPRIPLLISIGCFPITLLLSYGFILGHFNLPKLGFAGIACASLITQLMVLSVLLIILRLQKSTQTYQIFKNLFYINKDICKAIFKLGMPIGVQFGGEISAITVSAILLSYFGQNALAASQIVTQYFMLVLMLILNLTQALSILISGANGNNNVDEIKQYLRASGLILLVYSSLSAIFFLGFPSQLTQFYLGHYDASLLPLTTAFFAISSLVLLVDGVRHLLSGALRGLQDSQAPMQIGVFSIWLISLPVSYLCGFVTHHGPVGLRLGFVSGFFVAVIMLGLRLRKKFTDANLTVGELQPI